MKQTDFQRLKQICEKEGFELIKEVATNLGKFFVVTKPKDIWEGVEFAECLIGSELQFTEGKTYQLSRIYGDSHKRLEVKRDDYGVINWFPLRNFKPSTEQAYIEQLKAEAFKRLGDIKDGDIKDGDSFINPRGAKVEVDINFFGKFNYDKLQDILDFGGCYLYEKGKWATRVTKRIEVTVSGYDLTDYKTHNCFEVEFFIHDSEEFDRKSVSVFLGRKLEEYLNEKK